MRHRCKKTEWFTRSGRPRVRDIRNDTRNHFFAPQLRNNQPCSQGPFMRTTFLNIFNMFFTPPRTSDFDLMQCIERLSWSSAVHNEERAKQSASLGTEWDTRILFFKRLISVWTSCLTGNFLSASPAQSCLLSVASLALFLCVSRYHLELLEETYGAESHCIWHVALVALRLTHSKRNSARNATVQFLQVIHSAPLYYHPSDITARTVHKIAKNDQAAAMKWRQWQKLIS